MSVSVVACTCHNSDNAARRVLSNAGVNEWKTFPVERGKDLALRRIKLLSSLGYDMGRMADYIKNKGAFIVFIGYTTPDQPVVFQDTSGGKMADRIRAEELVKNYINL